MQDLNADNMAQRLEDILPVIRAVSEQFKNPVSAELASCLLSNTSVEKSVTMVSFSLDIAIKQANHL